MDFVALLFTLILMASQVIPNQSSNKTGETGLEGANFDMFLFFMNLKDRLDGNENKPAGKCGEKEHKQREKELRKKEQLEHAKRVEELLEREEREHYEREKKMIEREERDQRDRVEEQLINEQIRFNETQREAHIREQRKHYERVQELRQIEQEEHHQRVRGLRQKEQEEHDQRVEALRKIEEAEHRQRLLDQEGKDCNCEKGETSSETSLIDLITPEPFIPSEDLGEIIIDPLPVKPEPPIAGPGCTGPGCKDQDPRVSGRRSNRGRKHRPSRRPRYPSEIDGPQYLY